MQSINLARRPFVNRRPVFRLAILLWVAGAALTVYNLTQYLGHWQGKDEISGALDQVHAEVQREQTKLAALDQQLARVSLGNENIHAEFLNRLIAYRTFPWSTLFDDLEEVIPFDVRLHSVSPGVNLKPEPEKPTRRSRRLRSRRAASARRSSAQPAAEATGDTPAVQDADTRDAEEEVVLRHGEVRLALAGVAKTEDALVELIEELYESPYFHSPFLPGEAFNADGSVNFRISAVYVTRSADGAPAAGDEPAEAEDLAPAVAEVAGGEKPGEPREGVASRGQPVAAAGGVAAASRSDEDDSDARSASARSPSSTAAAGRADESPPRDPRRRQPAVPKSRLGVSASGAPPAGAPSAGAPSAGTPAVGIPAVGSAPAGAPSAGTPVAGTPVAPAGDAPVAGTATAGAPSVGTAPAGRPAAGRPPAGTPPAGIPPAGIPPAGTPAPPGSEPPPPSGSAPPGSGAPGAPPPPVSEGPEFEQPSASDTPSLGSGEGSSARRTPGRLGHPDATQAAPWEARA